MKQNPILLILSLTATFSLLYSCKKDGISGDISAYFEVDQTDVKTGDVVHFKALTAGTVARYDWTFEGGYPETSNLSSPQVQWFDAGNYTVTLTVSNINGSISVTRRKVITVDYCRSISADFVVDRTTATNEEEVNFTNISAGYPTSFLWTFRSDNGYVLTSEEENPSVVLQPGMYTVTLKAYNPVTSDTKLKSSILYVIDKDSVSAAFGWDKSLIVQDGTVRFTDKSLGKVEEWLWEFPGGTPSTSTEVNPTVKYETPGEYSAKLTVKNSLSESSDEKTGCVNVLAKKDMVIFLPMDSDLKDSSPNKYDASFFTVGSASNSFGEGHSSNSSASVYLPGGNKNKCSVIQLPADNWQSKYPQGSDMTLSMWVKTFGSATGHSAFFAQGSCPGVLEAGNNQIWARMQSTGEMRMLVESYQGTGNGVQVDNIWADGQWHHYAFVYKTVTDGKRSAYMYIDGVLQGSSLNKDNKMIDTTPFFIGCNLRYSSGWAPEACLDGYVDDVILYSSALDESEIIKLSKY